MKIGYFEHVMLVSHLSAHHAQCLKPLNCRCKDNTSSNQWLGSAGARLLRDARHKRHRSLHGSTCGMDSNATKARSTLRRVAEQLLILANEGQ